MRVSLLLKYGFILFLFALSCGNPINKDYKNTFSEANFEVKLDTLQIRIGEQLKMIFGVNQIGLNDKVEWPILRDSLLGNFEIVDSTSVDTIKRNGLLNLTKKYFVTNFEDGEQYFPPISLEINNRKLQIDSIRLFVVGVAIDTLKQKMYPIKNVIDEPYTLDEFYNLILIIIISLIVIAIAIYLIKKYRNKAPEIVIVKPKILPFKEAKKLLKELDEKELIKKDKLKEYVSELGIIFRNYLERQFDEPALESTTHEMENILLKIRNEINYDSGTYENIMNFLRESDFVKFAKYKPNEITLEKSRKDIELIIEKFNGLLKEKTQENDQS